MRLDRGGPWRAAAGGAGALRRTGGHPAAVLRRLTAPIGRLQWGEIRPAHPAEPGNWTPLTAPETRFRDPWLCRELREADGALTRTEAGRRYAAVPYDPARPFPLTPLFCFARIRRIGSRDYAVFAFDDRGDPTL